MGLPSNSSRACTSDSNSEIAVCVRTYLKGLLLV